MNTKPQMDQSVQEEQIRAALDQHWPASDASDFKTEHDIYRRGCYAGISRSQASECTGESIYRAIAATSRAKSRLTVRRIIGSGDLWITEFIMTYDGKPSYTVSIMEFSGGQGCAGNTVFRGSLRGPGVAEAMGSADRVTPRREF